MDVLTFMAENPWQTFFLLPFVFVLMFLSALIMESVMKFLLIVINRTFRTIKVLFRGWPPVHLDADGDFRKMGPG
jgi:hypothetical protein